MRYLKILLFIFICQLAGVIGSLFTFSAIPAWYAGLNKPFFSPPNWLFGPTWVLLYSLMGIAVYLIWTKGLKKENVKNAIKIFAIQLILNALWSIIFFGAKQPLIAFFEIALLWYLILLTILKFYKISKPAAYLLVPYLIWVSFASVLNFYIWRLN